MKTDYTREIIFKHARPERFRGFFVLVRLILLSAKLLQNSETQKPDGIRIVILDLV